MMNVHGRTGPPTLLRTGMSTPLVLTVVLVGAALAGAFYFASQNRPEAKVSPPPDAMTEQENGAPQSDIGDPAAGAGTGIPVFSPTGTVFAGTTTPFIDFNRRDYEQALRDGRIIVLYFYANWCPICAAEIPKAEAAFEQLQLPGVVGFRVNYNDDATDDYEENLARQFGIAYQHTKVILLNGQQVLKNGSTWDTARYIAEITNAGQ